MRLPLVALLSGLAAALPGCTGVGNGTTPTAGAPMLEDRRTTATTQMDEEAQIKAAALLLEARMEGVHANFNSFNRRLLITGEAPTEAIKNELGQRVGKLANVREVDNELAIAGPTTVASRTSDSYTSARVKVRLLDDRTFSANHIKVVTENGVVYLMGLVTRPEGQTAAEIAAQTAGVRRVIKLFEYQN